MGLVSKGSSLDLFDGVTRSQLDDFAIKNTHIRFVFYFFVFVPTIIKGKKTHLLGELKKTQGVALFLCAAPADYKLEMLENISWKTGT